jgi:hypothetical protein
MAPVLATYSNPLTALDPPRHLPLCQTRAMLSVAAAGSVCSVQVRLASLRMRPTPSGMRLHSPPSCSPASSSSTRRAGSSDSLPAITQPAEPPPTIT